MICNNRNKRLEHDMKIQLDLSTWARLPEALDYAAERGLDLPTAILFLLNSGLSHG